MDTQPTNQDNPASLPQKKKGKPITRLTRYELTRLRQKLWREKRDVMEKIRTYAVQVAKKKFDDEDKEFRQYVASTIPEKASMDEIRAIVEAGNFLNRTFKNPSKSRKMQMRNGMNRLTFGSFIARCRRRGYLVFELESFTWTNKAKEMKA